MQAQLSLLGLPTILIDGASSAVRLTMPNLVLIYLAYRSDWVARSELAFLFKPDDTEAEGLKHLRLLLYRAKKLNWVSTLEVEDSRVRFLIPTDVARFKEALKEENWHDASQLYKQNLLAQHSTKLSTYNAWLELERDELQMTYLLALTNYATALEQSKQFEGAADILANYLRVDAHDETIFQAYVRNLALAGLKSKAIKAYDNFSKLINVEFDAEPLEETQKLIALIQNDDISNYEPQKQSTSDSKLPQQGTRFVGRRNELKDLSSLLNNPACRLLSLIGLGGSGKTRLALELGRLEQNNFQDGTFFVPLTALQTSKRFFLNLAQSLDITLGPKQDAFEEVKKYLAEKQSLLIFDNFEHLLDAAPHITSLLSSSKTLKIIITSRQRLELKAEWLYDLEGLSYPEDETRHADELQAYDAVQLFLSSAKRNNPMFELQPSDMKAAAKIAKHVQGLPLALELAASWVKTLDISAIEREIKTNQQVLTSESQDLPERHRNLHLIIQKTWENLSSIKQETLAKFSIFQAGCTLEAAERITGAHFSLLLSLVNESLLTRVKNNRFDMHPLLKSHSHTILTEQQTLEVETSEQHAEYYANLLKQQLGPDSKPTASPKALEPDSSNLENAWFYLLHSNQEALADIVKPFFDFYNILGFYQPGIDLLTESINQLGNSSHVKHADLYCNLQLSRAFLARESGGFDLGESSCIAALDIAQKYNLKPLIAESYRALGDTKQMMGKFEASQEAYEKALSYFEKLDNKGNLANTLNSLASLETMQEKYEQAAKRFAQCADIFEEIDDQMSKAIALNNLGYIAEVQTHYKEATAYYEASLAIFEELNFLRGIAAIKNNLAVFYGMIGELDKAEAFGKESLALKEDAKDTLGKIITLKNLGDLQLKRNNPQDALKYYLPALKTAHELNATPRLLQVLLSYAKYLNQSQQTKQSKTILNALLSHPICTPSIKEAAKELEPDLGDSVVVNGRLVSDVVELIFKTNNLNAAFQKNAV